MSVSTKYRLRKDWSDNQLMDGLRKNFSLYPDIIKHLKLLEPFVLVRERKTAMCGVFMTKIGTELCFPDAVLEEIIEDDPVQAT